MNHRVKRPYRHGLLWLASASLLVVLVVGTVARAQDTEPTVPVFVDGEAQVVPGFKDPDNWIRHDLWVETEFDSDGDGKLDRVHVDVTRPRQTETEGLKLPVIYVSSPYFAGTGSTAREYFWDTRHEVGAAPPERKHFPPDQSSEASVRSSPITCQRMGAPRLRRRALVVPRDRTVARLPDRRRRQRVTGPQSRDRLAQRSGRRIHHARWR